MTVARVGAAANVNERRQLQPEIAVSTVIFGLFPRSTTTHTQADPQHSTAYCLKLPLVRRIRQPFKGQFALPGGPLHAQESLTTAAARNLLDTTGLAPGFLAQLYTFGGLERSPGLRVVSVVYWALLHICDSPAAVRTTSEQDNVEWFEVSQLPTVAFDHQRIINYALHRLRNSVTWGDVAYRALGDRFTLAQLREVYESVLGHRLDPGNFQRQVKTEGDIVATNEFLTGGRHRPPRLYRYTGNSDFLPQPPG